MNDFDKFDEMMRDALVSDETPSSDFTRRVMAQVAATPQERLQRRAFPYLKVAAAAAACLVLVYVGTLPLRMRMGSAAPQAAYSTDSAAMEAAPEAAEMPDETAGGTEDSYGFAADNSLEASLREESGTNDALASASQKAAAIGYRVEVSTREDGVTVCRLTTPAGCAAAELWLAEQGFADDGGYVLHAVDVAAMNEALPGLSLPEGDCVLILAPEA